jgi:hypothetical protein
MYLELIINTQLHRFEYGTYRDCVASIAKLESLIGTNNNFRANIFFNPDTNYDSCFNDPKFVLNYLYQIKKKAECTIIPFAGISIATAELFPYKYPNVYSRMLV